MKYPVLIFSFLLLSMFSGCDKCKEKTMSTKQFETEYGCPDTKHSLEVDLTDACVLISSKEEYDDQVTGNCHPNIDFTIYSLIIGKQSTSREVDTILYEYKTVCPDDELTLTVDIVQSAVIKADTVVYHTLIPKPESGADLYVNINTK